MLKQQAAFLDRFTLDECLIDAPALSGQPHIYIGFDSENGSQVLIKVWTRQSHIDDKDLEFLWRNEIRQIQRLLGYPGAKDYLLPMHEAGADSKGFYLVMNSGQRLPLSWLNANPSQTRSRLTLKNTARVTFWQNMNRVAKGLGLLHAQGLIHRNLDESSIFTEGGNNVDYQLGGFEWNVRLNSSAIDIISNLPGGNKTQYHSFSHDWQSFGSLAARLLKIVIRPITPAAIAGAVSLNIDEKKLLSRLIFPVPFQQLDCSFVSDNIRQIVEEHTAQSGQIKGKLHLIFDFSVDKNKIIQKMDESDFTVYDISAAEDLLDFLNSDLAEASVIKLKPTENNQNQYALQGCRFTYYLKEHRQHEWQVALINNVSENSPHSKRIQDQVSISGGQIAISTPLEVTRNIVTIRGDALDWESVFTDSMLESGDVQLNYDALLLLHLIEFLDQLTQVWAVVVKGLESGRAGDTTYTVELGIDTTMEQLSDALGLKKPINRLIETLDNPPENRSGQWHISDHRVAGGRNISDEWAFIERASTRNNREHFRFVGRGNFAIDDILYLSVLDAKGQKESFARRTRLLRRLKNHGELMDVLVSPLLAVRPSHDPAPVLDADKLDSSKRQALEEIFRVLPIYLLQGPPGVGKTHLVTELVKQRFMEDSSARILVSAQGHETVNTLMQRIKAEIDNWDEDKKPLVVRSRSKRNLHIDDAFLVRNQAEKILNSLTASQFYRDSPALFQGKLSALLTKIKNTQADESFPDKALETLLFRSANLVFSTTNSADLERLVKSVAQFDWSIIEEAGRATGIELLAPLMLSHRRLLIGDPNQLPPFGEDKIMQLLKTPEQLHKAFEQGRNLLDSSLNELGAEELIDYFSDPSEVNQLMVRVRDSLSLFKSHHQKTSAGQGQYPIAGGLDQQHRMHPEIADVVSKIFYDGKLSTSEACSEGFKTCSPYTLRAESGLTFAPIVIVDMPYVQKQAGSLNADCLPHYHNPSEVDAVITILSSLQVSGNAEKKPSLAVLTPYNEQAKRLRRKISAESPPCLNNLQDFEMGEELVQTIDSFQGNEADIVVVSLVRNNEHNWKKGLGILGDPRRMNVMLSRAKWKLIVVCSLDFLRARFLTGKTITTDSDLYFLHHWIQIIDNSISAGNKGESIDVIPFNELGLKGKAHD
tara:strand:- start:2186 stop:5668 length:3483 start_codon:yes stop_codon:yes gene_type:complete